MQTLKDYGLLRCSGNDVQAFLQSQLTHDITLLTPGQAQLNGWCNPKGRLRALFRIWEQDRVYYLRCPQPLLTQILPQLSMFILRADVQIDNLSDRWHGYWSATDITTNTKPSQTVHVGSGWECWSEHQLEDATTAATPISASREAIEIQQGLPEIYTSSTAAFIPQMVNLDQLDGMSFTKGCYPGQEITARLKYLGEIKKRMQRVCIQGVPTNHTICPGDDIRSEEDALLGHWVRPPLSINGQSTGLAILATDGLTDSASIALANGQQISAI